MPRTVLVADDDPPILDLVGELLAAEGYDVRLATDGLDALDQALAAPPDLIVTDFKMPNLDGLALAERLRERDRSVPILLMSAVPPATSPPGIDVIRKPFDVVQLVSAVANALGT
jgi:two-component system response regulator MprA